MSDEFYGVEEEEEEEEVFDDNSSSPILYTDTDSCLKVYTNLSGELFIENTQSGVYMRINSSHRGELEFTIQGGRIDPIQINGLIGWWIHRG